MRQTYKKKLDEMRIKMSAFPWEDPEFYADYLAQTYYFVRHSTRLLAIAGGKFPYEDNSHHKRFMKHIDEEKNHEMIALSDLKSLGYSIKDMPEHSLTKSFYESQYCKIDLYGPASFFGYILMLEGVAIEVFPEIYNRLVEAHGERAVKFLKLHVEEDIDHIEKAWKNIDEINESCYDGILENIIQTSETYIYMLESINMKLEETYKICAQRRTA